MIQFIEALSLNAWQSLQTLVYDGWLIRLSNGFTKRANSIQPLYGSSEDLREKLCYVEALYREKRLPTVFKMTETASPGHLDRQLGESGYRIVDPTSVQTLDLVNVMAPVIHTVKWDDHFSDEWLQQVCTFNQQDEDSLEIMKNMLSLIIPKACFMSLYHGKTAVACGLGVLERGYLGIFDIITDRYYRRKGFAEQLILNLLKWGKANGAETAYLQVLLDNAPALRLYSKLGFKEGYQYWYRVKA
ncbi:putative N-acetyltransferase YobR [Pullulanibacillus camelliae]|uniref:Putative N-acetyltransferase YobR n=1 Tax=Pullulanibacillus camelliae TaxID=1707096 RepID=A0A8J2VPW0_9BACL|nr:GNAT family N-acetyltransferase [Pullulanibacillus camelliae]GGE36738.1 putative N-acetyltransferase YobR [Pullulanibacillus camelliae]